MAALKQLQYKILKGMNLDLDFQSCSPDFAYYLYNLKTLLLDSSTNGSLTNEKGNTKLDIYNAENLGSKISLTGDTVGVIQCDSYTAVLFCYAKNTRTNYIYKITYSLQDNKILGRLVAKGQFNIIPEAVISGVFVYENSELQKVYWVDGINPLRFLNIADSNSSLPIEDELKMNASPAFSFNHHMEVEPITGGGLFTSGVIQYAFTYFNKNGAETGIVDMTPLYYIAEDHKGIREDEIVGKSFKVSIINPDTSFDYIRLYSIQRNSLSGPPVVKIVKDIKLNSSS